jgi:hypothetical protein
MPRKNFVGIVVGIVYLLQREFVVKSMGYGHDSSPARAPISIFGNLARVSRASKTGGIG